MKIEHYKLNSIIDALFAAFNRTHEWSDYTQSALNYVNHLSIDDIHGIQIAFHAEHPVFENKSNIHIFHSYKYIDTTWAQEVEDIENLLNSISILKEAQTFNINVCLYFYNHSGEIIEEDFDNETSGLLEEFSFGRKSLKALTEEEALKILQQISIKA